MVYFYQLIGGLLLIINKSARNGRNGKSDVDMVVGILQQIKGSLEVSKMASMVSLIRRVRIVCISDTHGLHLKIPAINIPDGDVLIHAGDFTNTGEQDQIESFMNWFGSQPHRYKILIAGNHDVTLDEEYYIDRGKRRFHPRRSYDIQQCKAMVRNYPNINYLEDSGVLLEFGSEENQEVKGYLRVWGSPWQPEFCDWAFNLDRGEPLRRKWDLVPSDTDVLITHGPPQGILDQCADGFHAGCEALLEAIATRIRPKLHVCGHIHEAYGMVEHDGICFVNASTCNYSYRPINPAIVVDIPVELCGDSDISLT